MIEVLLSNRREISVPWLIPQRCSWLRMHRLMDRFDSYRVRRAASASVIGNRVELLLLVSHTLLVMGSSNCLDISLRSFLVYFAYHYSVTLVLLRSHTWSLSASGILGNVLIKLLMMMVNWFYLLLRSFIEPILSLVQFILEFMYLPGTFIVLLPIFVYKIVQLLILIIRRISMRLVFTQLSSPILGQTPMGNRRRIAFLLSLDVNPIRCFFSSFSSWVEVRFARSVSLSCLSFGDLVLG